MFRKSAIPLLIMFLFTFLAISVAPVLAANPSPEKIKAYIGQLEVKLRVAKKENNAKRIKTIEKLIAEQKAALAGQPEAVQSTAPQTEEDKLSDYKEENNKALAELKGQIDKVKSDNSDAKVGAQIFFRWQKPVQNGGTMVNNFDVDRAYIDIKKKLDWNASARLTLDVARITGAARQNLFDYLKYAYVEAPVTVPGALQIIPWELTAKIGLQHTVWIDWADKQLGLRFIAKSLLDNEGVMSSSDFGLGALGKVSIPGLPEVEYQATVLNGTGYATNESNGTKSLAMRVNSTVFDGGDAGKAIVGLFLNIDSLSLSSFSLSGNGIEKQAGLAVSYQHDKGRVFMEYLTGTKSAKKISGTSLGGVLLLGGLTDILSGYSLFARMDNYDPNTNAANDLKAKSFYGVIYDWGKDVKFAADMQTSQTGSGSTASTFYLHSMITM